MQREIGLAVSVGFVDRFLGRLAALRGFPEEAERHFEAALDPERARRGDHVARSHQDEYAEMLLERDTADDRERAGLLLEQSRLKAEELDMAPVAKRAETLAAEHALAPTG